jgi:16S rRNA processing protein RimM
LPRGQFFWHQIIGLTVETADGRQLGRVEDVLRTGANDVYVVRGDLGEVLVPAIAPVVKRIDPDGGRLVVELIPGMLPRED